MTDSGSNESFFSRLNSATSQKLNEANYIIWSHNFETFLMAHMKQNHLTEDPPDVKDERYAKWNSEDAAVVTWMLHSMEPHIANGVAMLRPTKKMWESLKQMYGDEKNISRVVDIYEQLFSLQMGTQSVQQYYATLRSLMDELEVYQPPTTDIAKQRRYKEDLAVAVFLSGLPTELATQVRGQILGADTLPDLTSTFGKVVRLSTKTQASDLVQSAMSSTYHHSRGGGRGGHANSKGRTPCEHCGRVNHKSECCWKKFGKPTWAQTSTETVIPPQTDRFVDSSPQTNNSSLMTKFAEFLQLQERQASGMASRTTIGTANLASGNASWLIDSGTSSHMTGLKTCFCPCGTFSKIATVVKDREISSAEACNDLMAYSLILSCCCYTCCIRKKLRGMFRIKGGYCDDFLSHLMCCCCALVQEWREVEIRGAHRDGNLKTKTSPPTCQSMES